MMEQRLHPLSFARSGAMQARAYSGEPIIGIDLGTTNSCVAGKCGVGWLESVVCVFLIDFPFLSDGRTDTARH